MIIETPIFLRVVIINQKVKLLRREDHSVDESIIEDKHQIMLKNQQDIAIKIKNPAIINGNQVLIQTNLLMFRVFPNKLPIKGTKSKNKI